MIRRRKFGVALWDFLTKIFEEDLTLYGQRCEEILWSRREKRKWQGARRPSRLEF